MHISSQHSIACILLVCVVALSSCVHQRDPEVRDDGAVGLISVGSSTLFEEDIEGLTNDEMLPEDSAIVVSSFIERWGKDQLIALEAEDRFGDDENINALVKEYRNSLLLEYMTDDIESSIDTTIRSDELAAFYEKNKDKYLLTEAAIKPLFVKLPRKSKLSDNVKSLWKKKTTEAGKTALLGLGEKPDVTVLSNTWMSVNDVAALLEDGTFGSQRKGKDYIDKTDKYRYFLYLEDVKEKGDPAPLQFVYNRVRHAYRYQQKRDHIKEYRDNLYKKGIDRGTVRLGQ